MTTPTPKRRRAWIDPCDFDRDVWDELKAFAEFGEADIAALEQTALLYEDAITEVVDRFYEHLGEFPEVRTFLEGHDLERLKKTQRHYLRSLSAGAYGDDYLRTRLEVGLAHHRIGLPLRWFLGGYWLYLRELVGRLIPNATDSERTQLLAFLKILVLDAQLISESYIGKTMAQVEEQNQRLERTITERTRQLSRWERLAAVGSMSAKVAHEIRNPLSSISLNTELLGDELDRFPDAETQESRELLSSVIGEVERLERIMDEYLSFARLPRPDFESVDLVEILQDVVHFLAPEFESHGIAVQVLAPHPVPSITLDRDQFRQALLNLLRNSQEAMPTGGAITVSIGRAADGAIEVAVIDTGVGLEDGTDVAQLFDPFYTTKDTGTGLGLPFVQQVVQEHHGEVRATGTPGGGATFRVRLPVALVIEPPS